MGFFGDLLGIAAPIIGTAIAPGLGTAIGGAVGSAIGGGDDLPPAVGGGGPNTGGGGILGTGITWQDVLHAAPYVIGGVGAVNAMGQQNAANDLRKEALDRARTAYDERAPLRSRALGLLTGPMPTPPDLTALRDTANPYAAGAAVTLPRVPIGGPPVSVSPTTPTTPQTIRDVLHDAFSGTVPSTIGGALGDALNKLPKPASRPGGFVSRLLPSVPSGVVDSGNHPLTAEQYRYAMTHREGVR